MLQCTVTLLTDRVVVTVTVTVTVTAAAAVMVVVVVVKGALPNPFLPVRYVP